MNPNIINNNLTGILVYELSGRTYCIDMKYVHLIVNPHNPMVTVLEGGNNFSQIRLGEKITKLIDIAKALNLDKNEQMETSRIILVKINGIRFAFSVDKIIEVITLIDKDFEQKLKFIDSCDEEYISGKILYDSNYYILPDYMKITENLVCA